MKREFQRLREEPSDSECDSGAESVDSRFDEASSEPFYTGLWSGIAFTLSGLVLWDMLMDFVIFETPRPCLNGNAARHDYWPMYTSIFTIVLWAVCWSTLLFVWTNIGCDYCKLLNIRPHSKHDYARFAGKLVIMVCLGRCIFNRTQQCKKPFDHLTDTAPYQPLMLCILIAVYLGYRFCGISRLILAAVASPFAAAGVTALDAYVGDVLTSLVKPLLRLVYIACFYGTGELISSDQKFCEEYTYSSADPFSLGTLTLLFPNVLRIAQTLRQYRDSGHKHPYLTNTCKYLCSLAITLYGLFHRSHNLEITQAHGLVGYWLYIAAMLCATLYAFLWDITMDWNLFTSSNTFLCIPYKKVGVRQRRLLGGLGPYVAAAAADFVLRFFYIRNFVPCGSFSFGQQLLDTFAFFAPELEVLRRAMWSVFKMEAMQLKADDEAAARRCSVADAEAMEESEQLEE